MNEGESITITASLREAWRINRGANLETSHPDVSYSPSRVFFPANDGSSRTFTISVAHDDDALDETTTLVFFDDLCTTAWWHPGNPYGTTGNFDPAQSWCIVVTLNIIDDEASGTIDVSPSGSLTLAEGQSKSIDITLSEEPDDDVTVSLSSGNSDISFSPASLTFTPSNYSTAQQLTVLAAHDFDHLDENETITLSATGGFVAPDTEIPVTITDDDELDLYLTATSLKLQEGENGTFQVRLGTQPSQDVTVTVRSSFRVASVDTDPNTAGNQDTILFARTGSANAWSEYRQVIVTATQDDDARNETATISLTAAGGDYQDESASVAVTITDDEKPRILISTTTLSVPEGGCTTFGVRPATRPTANIKVNSYSLKRGELSSDGTYYRYKNTTDIWTHPRDLHFNRYGQTNAWNQYQDLSVCANHDDDKQDDGPYRLLILGVGGDYQSVSSYPYSVDITVIDDDSPGTIEVSPAGSLDIDEDEIGSLQVHLSAAPKVDVTVSLSNANPDIVLSPPSLTFTPSNYSTAQSVTVAASQDADFMDDTDTITLSASGGRYDGAASVEKAVVVTDDEVGFDITPTSLTLAEGGQSTFQIRLKEQPAADMRVIFGVTDENSQQGGAADRLTLDADPNTDGNQITLVFARTGQENAWNQSRTIAVSAGHDDDGSDESLRISLSVEEGDDVILNAMSLGVSVIDDDRTKPSGTILISPAGDLYIDEGDFGAITVSLSTVPIADVSVTLSKTNPDITLSASSLTFNVSNYSTAQTVIVSAASDADDVDDADTITLSATGGIVAPQVTKTVAINDLSTATNTTTPSGTLILEPAGYLSVDEGGSKTFTVRLSIAPIADVSVALSKNNSDITLSTNSLTFTPSNYSTAQTVTVSVAHDADADAEFGAITLSASGGIVAPEAKKNVSIEDDEVAGAIFIEPTASLDLDEGESGEFTVRLLGDPNADVTVTLTKTNPDITLSANSLTFTPSNHSTAQTVTVLAVQDADADDESDTITLTAAGGIVAERVTKAVSVDDDEVAGTLILEPADSLAIAEGDSKTFTVRLSNAPNGDAIVTLTKTDPDITLSADSLTFTASNYSTAQSVTVLAPQDDDATSESDTITLTVTGGIVAPQATKTVTVADDDAPSGTIITSPAGALTIAEGGSASIAVQLSTAPNADVTVTLSKTDDALSLDKTSVTFTPSNWNQAQSIVASSLADNDTDDDRIDISLVASGGINAPETVVTVMIEDGNLPGGLSLSPSMLEVIGGDSATLSLSLASKPSTDDIVQVFLSKTDPNLSLEPASLTFDASNWNQAQSVVLNAAVVALQGSDTLTLSVSGQGNYAMVDDTTLPVRILEAPGAFSLSPESQSVIEGGAAVQLETRLQTRPLGATSVTITFTADRSGVRISPAVLIFPADGWHIPRTVEVEAVDDANTLDEEVAISAVAVGGNYGNVQQSAKVLVQDDDDESIPLPPIRTQALALPQSDAQDSATIRVRCIQDSPCDVVLDCHAQADGSAFEASLPDPIPAWGAIALSSEDIERLSGASWAGKGRLGCALRSQAGLSAQVWTHSGDGVLVNNSAFIRSVPDGAMHRADIESIPTPDGLEDTNIRIRCLAPLGSDCAIADFSCYDDDGIRYEGDIGTIERLRVRHLQTTDLAELIDHRWQGMGLVCELRSSAPFTVQVLTRTGGGGALVNNSATGAP